MKTKLLASMVLCGTMFLVGCTGAKAPQVEPAPKCVTVCECLGDYKDPKCTCGKTCCGRTLCKCEAPKVEQLPAKVNNCECAYCYCKSDPTKCVCTKNTCKENGCDCNLAKK